MAGRDDRHLSMRARNATTRLTEYTATRVRYKPVTYERVLTLFVPARVFTGARSSSHASPLGPARHSPGDSLFRSRENKQVLALCPLSGSAPTQGLRREDEFQHAI